MDGHRPCVHDVLGLPLKPDHISHRHEQLCAVAGLDRIRMHDLRHTAASLMLAGGTPVHVVAAILGHDPAICLRIHAHLVPGHTDEAAAALTRSIVEA